MTCETCGAALQIGDYPFCPHGGGTHAIEPVTWPGGKTFENLANEPLTFYDRASYKRYLRTHHLEEFVRNAGPDDRHVPRWAGMDAQTLANAAALVSRCGKASATPPPATYIRSLTLTETVTDDAPLRVRMGA